MSARPRPALSGRRRLPISLRAGSVALLATSIAMLAGLFACSAPPPLRQPRRPAPTGPAVVPVLLTGLTGQRRIEATVSGTRLRFEASPAGVSCSDGRTGPHLETGGSRSRIELGGRSYTGRLDVEPGPGGGLQAVLQAPLEHYVAGVVTGELILYSALPAELEAQAVAARTYATRRLGGSRSAPLRDDTRDQRFVGSFRPSTPSEGPIAQRVETAVAATRGMVLTDSTGRLIEANFHAACGGHTATPAVFGAPLDLRSRQDVECSPCRSRAARGDADLAWDTTISREEWSAWTRQLGIGQRLVGLRPVAFDADGERWLEVELSGSEGARRVSFEALRARFGPNRLRSARITRTWPAPGAPIEGGVFFAGLGRGHGVGLCQEGARGYARGGSDVTSILQHYYPGTRLVRLATPEAARRALP